jgi:hypothetical protein
MSRYDLDTVTLGRLLDDPDAVAAIESIVPGLTSNPMLAFARGMTASQALAAAGSRADPDTKRRLIEALQAL